MFDRIAGRYDFLNHLLSLQLDRSWRRRAAAETRDAPPGPALDLCGGTGDLALAVAAARPREEVVCADFSPNMLARAERKFAARGVADRCRIREADALALPFPEGAFAAVTVGFGIRNLADMDAGLREMRRVLRPGGRLVVLEFSTPTLPGLAQVYRWYLGRVLPRVGDRVSGRNGPYGYLARTIAAFPGPDELATRIRAAGFAGCRWRRLTGGIVAIHVATVAP